MKKFFLGLIAFGLSIISFGYCTDDVATLLDTYTLENVTIPQQGWGTLMNLQTLGLQYKTLCIKFIQSTPMTTDWGPTNSYQTQPGTVYRTWWDWINDGKYTCTYVAGARYLNANSPDGTNTFDIEYFILEDLMATPLPLMTSLQCQTEYSLIPISSVDSNYCSTNGLCPSYYVNLTHTDSEDSSSTLISDDIDLVVGTGITVDEGTLNTYIFDVDSESCVGGSGNWSALFINGIQHVSSPLINVSIADWVPWDYSFDEDSFDLDVGSGYDQDYIDGVIDVQSYRPTSEDFTQTFVGGLILFTPYVVILLFVILVWKLIKGIFKTK